ncbi:unnamed protein product [Brassicogethes aeneus]|uniref:Uncharacterized protein n=1 Tax=Brassicogethes aeneus TaxID=1431903 RepID=A0A9P0BCQ3_BRAAE|nr:unnamed protein product [Brassicogethes aeneus]
MKPSLLFIFLLFFLSVSAQRRAPTKPDTPEPEKPQSPPRGRGRARFSTTPEFTKISETQKDESAPARKRVNPVALERRTPPAIPSRTYAVQENVEDSPIESFRRQSKPRILTESRFEARNAPKKVVSEPASKPDTVDELFNSYGSNAADKTEAATAETTVKQEVTSEAESSTASTEAAKQENEIKRETTRSQSEVTTPKTAPKRRTNVIRSRVNPSQVPAESTTTGRSRVRTRATRRPDESSSTAAPLLRSSGRSSRRNGASLFVAEESQDAPSRSRTGRRINAREEVVPGDLITASTTRTRVVTNRKPLGSTTIKPTTGRRGSSRFASSLPSTTTVIPARDAVTPKKTLRSRTRVTPPVFDETKLEVLPLFEVEAKTVLPPGDILKPSASGSKSRYPSKPNDISSRVTVSHRVETRRQTYFRQKTTTRKPQIKETVVAQISEVTSRSSRKRNNEIPVDAKSRVTQPRISIGSVASRRKPASALNRSTLTKSEEEIDDSDNYPPQFKALLQAKKLKQESRPTAAATSSSSSEKEESINNPTTPTTSVTTEVPVARVISSTVASSTTGAVRAKEVLEADNEVVPKATPPSFRPTRRAKAKITTTLNAAKRQTTFGRSSKFSRSTTTTTTSPPIVSKGDHRFHSKYTTKTEYSESSTVQNDKSAYVKPSRGVYSSRKSKESFRQVKSAKIPSEPIIQSAQITRGNTLAKKSSRFSSKYRGDTSGRGSVLHTRSTTSAPAYIPTIPTAAYVPTIPTLNPPSTGKWRKGHLDKDLGLEVLTIDDPVFTVPSANLVNEDFVSSTSNSLVTSEKSVSIIESVINAIKAISTTASPDSTSLLTTAQSEPGSAIQKLAPKKLNDKTNDSTDNSVTTEKPTTIIERILSSINAIEADDTNSNKVGTDDYNTVSFPSTTPMSRVAKSTSSSDLSAQSSTINPLSVLDGISEDTVLQKRTIGKLLSLLNSYTSPRSNLVHVTPKVYPPVSYSASPAPLSLLNLDSTTVTDNDISKDTSTTTTTDSPTVTATVVEVGTSTEPPSTTTSSSTSTDISSTETIPPSTDITTDSSRTTQDTSNDLNVLNLFVAPGATVSLAEGTTTPETTVTDSTETIYTVAPTLSTLSNFEVSPQSVSVFSANDLSNTITTDDSVFSTVTISARGNFETVTTESSTTESTTTMDSTSTEKSSTVESNTSSNTVANPTDVSNVTDSSPKNANRGGRLLNVEQDPVDNSLDSNTSSSTPDYFIFAVLNNNTILRKSPTTFPTQGTPYIVVGVYPNNTIVKKFPNGTVVPMEPIIRVDSNENTVPSADLIGSSKTTTTTENTPTTVSSTSTTESTTPIYKTTTTSIPVGNIDEILSISRNKDDIISSSSSTEKPELSNEINDLNRIGRVLNPSTTTIASTTLADLGLSTVKFTTPIPTFSTLSELLNGRTVDALNDIITKSKPNYETLAVNQDSSTSTIAPFTSSQSTDTATETPSTLNPLSETIPPQTTTAAQTTESIKVTTTTFKNVVPAVTTALPSITTFFPQLFNTILSTLQPITTTYASPTTVRTQRGSTDQSLAATTVVPTTVSPYTSRGRIAFSDTITTDTPIVTTRKRITTTTEIPTTRRRITTTTEIPTTRRRITTTTEIPTFTTTTREPETTTMRFRTTTERQVRLYTTEPVTSTETTTKKLRELTEEQKMNLATLAQLEKEQADLLAQLSLLTGLPNGRKPAANNANLANRIIAMAMDRDRAKSTTASSVESSFGTTLQGGNKEPSLEEVLKQYNIKGVQQVAASPKPAVSSTYGTSNDALIASLLKEQGIGPTTPSSLNGVFTTTRRPRPQTRPPGRLMQGLNWLLDVLSPQPQPQPQPRPRPRATTRRPISEEILTNQPTHITPVVTRAPPKTRLGPNELSQEDIQKLISQLETLQKNPRDGKALDLSQIKSLNALINTNEGVRVTSSGEIGTTRPSRSQMTTFMPITTNHIEQEETYIPTSSYRPSTVSLPAVRLRPVPGVDDNNSDPLIRGNLISAAVNVTRAISSFLGSALQDAIHQLKQMHYGNPDISNLFQNITESQINSTIV